MSYILVNCIGADDILDFLQNVVCKNLRMKIQNVHECANGCNGESELRLKVLDVRKTIFMNTYDVEIEKRVSRFPFRKPCNILMQFVAHDMSFDFGEFNKNGIYDAAWIRFLLTRCMQFPRKYSPRDEEYKEEIVNVLRREKLFLLSDYSFYSRAVGKIDFETFKLAVTFREDVYLDGIVADKSFFRGVSQVRSSKIVKLDYPIVVDEDNCQYVLGLDYLD